MEGITKDPKEKAAGLKKALKQVLESFAASILNVLAAFEYEVIQAREKMQNELEKFLGEIQQGGVLTRKEAAKYIGCGLTKFDSLVKGGRIKAVSYDEHCRFRRESLDQFLRDNER